MLKELMTRYPCLTACEQEIAESIRTLIACYEAGGKLLICGNGGSSADSDHIVGELMKGFLKKRPLSAAQREQMQMRNPAFSAELADGLQVGLPAVALSSINGLNTAFGNDVSPTLAYAQGVLGLGKSGDVLLAISTSGNADNVAAAAQTAKALGITVIGLTGAGGGKLGGIADIVIRVPETETFKVQELHLPVYHALCAAVEAHFFAE